MQPGAHPTITVPPESRPAGEAGLVESLHRRRVDGKLGGLRLALDRTDLGAAGAAPLVLAGPGLHRLAPVDAGGRVVDRVLFTVR